MPVRDDGLYPPTRRLPSALRLFLGASIAVTHEEVLGGPSLKGFANSRHTRLTGESWQNRKNET